jgi:S1-C subfamily serine protease
VPFTEKDVSVDRQAAAEMVRRTQQMGVPVIADEQEAIVGFDVRRLELMAMRSKTAPPRLGLRVKDAVGGGVEVSLVHPDTVGARVGVHAGDVVIALGGRAIQNGVELEQVWKALAGSATSVTVRRGGQVVELRGG